MNYNTMNMSYENFMNKCPSSQDFYTQKCLFPRHLLHKNNNNNNDIIKSNHDNGFMSCNHTKQHNSNTQIYNRQFTQTKPNYVYLPPRPLPTKCTVLGSQPGGDYYMYRGEVINNVNPNPQAFLPRAQSQKNRDCLNNQKILEANLPMDNYLNNMLLPENSIKDMVKDTPNVWNNLARNQCR